MSKISILIIAFLVSFNSYSQTNFPFYNELKGEKMIIVDTAISRVSSSIMSAPEDTLFFGTTVEIVMFLPKFDMRNNIMCPWLKVMYKKGLYKKIAFVSSLDISPTATVNFKNYQFAWGVCFNNRKDSVVNGEVFVSNDYDCKLFAIHNGNKLSESSFKVNDANSRDSFGLKVIEKIKLNKTLCGIDFSSYKLTNKQKEYFRNTFVLCKKNILIQLPSTHNYINVGDSSFPTTEIKFCGSKKFSVITNFQKMMPQVITDFYKWSECNYEMIK